MEIKFLTSKSFIKEFNKLFAKIGENLGMNFQPNDNESYKKSLE